MSSDIKLLGDSVVVEGTMGGSLYINNENTGLIVDASQKRVGLMKYYGREAGIWRISNQAFEIGRANVTELPGKPTAFTTDLYVAGNGNVGIGIPMPNAPLHVGSHMAVGPFAPPLGTGEIALTGQYAGLVLVRRDLKTTYPTSPTAGDAFIWYNPDGSARLWTEAKGDLLTVGKEGDVTINGTLAICTVGKTRTAVVGSAVAFVDYLLIVDKKGNVGIGTPTPNGKLDVNGPIFQRGRTLHADYVFESGYQVESIQEHAEFMWKNKRLKSIQPVTTDESGLEVVEVGSHFRSILEELEKAHIYIDQLHKQNKSLEERLTLIEERLGKVG